MWTPQKGGRCPSLPKLGSCKVPSWLSYFLVLRAARKGEASPLQTGEHGNCFCLFLYRFVLPQPNLCQDRGRLGAALSACVNLRLNEALLCKEALFWDSLVPFFSHIEKNKNPKREQEDLLRSQKRTNSCPKKKKKI